MDFKKVFLILLVGIFLVTFVSSAVLNDYKDYEVETKTALIKENVKGEIKQELKLKTNQLENVGVGYVQVAEVELTNYESLDYTDLIKSIEVYDINGSSLIEKQKTFDLKYKIEVIDERAVYEMVEVQDKNGTIYTKPKQVGYEEYTYYAWEDFNYNTILKGQTLTLGIFTTTYEGEHAEWIPTFSLGKDYRISEWASWIASLNSGLKLYVALNESSGTTAVDYMNSFNGTLLNTPTLGITGKYQNAMRFVSSSSEMVNFTTSNANNLVFPTGEFALSFWVNASGHSSGDHVISKIGSADPDADQYNGFAINMNSNGSVNAYLDGLGNGVFMGSPVLGTSWNHIVLMKSGTNATMWVNGVYRGYSIVTADMNNTEPFRIGKTWNWGNYFTGSIDEVALWNRSLTDSEVTTLYDSGTGTFCPTFLCTTNSAPSVTLNLPVNNSNLTTTIYNFNGTIYDDINLANVSFKIDGVIISTNTSGLNNSLYNFQYTGLTNGAHNWSLLATDNSSQTTESTRTFNVSVTAPVVTLQSPVTQYNITSQTNSFIGFVTSPDTLVNVSLVQNGTTITATTNTTGLNNTNYTFSGTFPEGSHTWNVIACDAQNDCGSGTTRTINIDTTSPTINITLPTAVSSYAESGQNETLNWTIYDANLNSCWYEYGGVNTSVTCSANTTLFTLGSGRSINFWGNDTFGNLAGSSRTWSYTLFLNSISYASEVYETSTATHILNLSYDTSTLAVTAFLEYDSINYSATKAVETNGAVFTREFDIPIGGVTGSKNFTWFMEVTEGVTQNSSTRQYNQTINEIYLGLCNVNQTIAGVNFTYYDEDLGTIINGTNAPTDFEGTFRYWVGSGDTYKNYSISNLSVSNVTYEFCINPSNNSVYQIHTDLDLIIGADGYNPNSYYLRNATLTNDTNYINLYLLNESLGQKFFFTSYVGVTPLADATITITKYFEGEGVYKAVGIALTDSSGAFTQYLELDKSYQFSAVQDGEYIGVVEKTSICTSAPCELTLQYNEGGESPFAGYFEVIAESVTGSLYFNQTTKMVMSSFTDITGTANYFRLLVSKTSLNETSLVVCDTTSYTTAGSITCNMTGYVGNFEAKLLISRSPEKIVELINFVTGSIQENLGTIALIVSAILLIVITFAGLRNPVIAVIGVPVALTALKIMDFLPLSWLFIGGITAVALFLIGRLKT